MRVTDTELREFLIGLKETLLLLGSWSTEGDSPTLVLLTHCQKFHLAKITRDRIDRILQKLQKDNYQRSEW